MRNHKWYPMLLAGLVFLLAGPLVACQPAPPVIVDFSCTPSEISAGEAATLSWVVTGASKVSIDKGIGMVDGVGTKEVSPSKTTTYTLLAINSGVVVSSSVVVRVGTASPPSPDTTPPVITNLSASSITAASAVVSWSTDEPATSQVEYGTTTDYGSTTALDEELVTSHNVSLSSLEPDTTYHFRVKSQDGVGNEAVATEVTFTTAAEADTTPPVISGVDVSDITESGATISWESDEPATSQVEYGATTDYGSSTLHEELVTSHSVTLIGLEPDTSYHFMARSKDASGNEGASTDLSFGTLAEADTTPPVISGVVVSNITQSMAAIAWTTDDPATSQVEYGGSTSYGSVSDLGETLVTSHSVVLSGLSPATGYYFRVRSKDGSENEAVSGADHFETVAPVDTTAPVISDVTAEAGGTNALIEWRTDELASSQVEYGTDTTYGAVYPSPPQNAPIPGTSLGVVRHQVVLGGLETGALYHCRVRSKDASGNEAVSGDSTFVVAETAPPEYGVKLLSPDNGCLGCAASPACFSWAPFKATTKYKFVLAKDAALTDVVAEAEVGTTAYEYDGTLDYSTNYFWRVMSLEPAPSDWSATFSFQTEAAP